jgi:hypothetical protein
LRAGRRPGRDHSRGKKIANIQSASTRTLRLRVGMIAGWLVDQAGDRGRAEWMQDEVQDVRSVPPSLILGVFAGRRIQRSA